MGKGSVRMLGWSIATIILLLSVITPLSIITFFLLMIPVVVQFVKLDTKRFLMYYGASLAIVYILTSVFLVGWAGVLLVSMSLFFLPPVIQMGNLYKKRSPARTVLTVGTVTLLAELLLSLVVSYLFGFNLIDKMKQFMTESINSLPDQLKGMVALDQDVLVQLMSQMLPLYMIGFSLIVVVITHWLSRKVLNRAGESIPAFKPMREWMLPRSFVWYYMIALFMEFFVKDANSILFTLLINLLPLLTAAFAIQALAFLFFVVHTNRWNKVLPIGGIVLLLIFPPAYFIFSMLGVFDVAFPIRERMTRK
ncbi:YybS family protein [Paenibacillus doosanensis]|uniref:YybS family protein n=1 Tax=Paenibacillus doosanensis TaxID=1229154 RepID=UPI0021806F99|nr:YybS family protein [Paenibacillus doosanensis]MCS7463092.1 YybS family protein [Paenibacillus doosanensis]